MDVLGEMAGFFVAHAVWCVSDADTLTPIMAYRFADGSKQMVRIADEQLEDAVRRGKDWLEHNPEAAAHAVLVFDGLITLADGKTDALIVNATDYGPPRLGFTMAIPYRPSDNPAGFAVYRPKFLDFEGSEPSWEALGEAFFRGVDQHEKGSAVWNASLDQSR